MPFEALTALAIGLYAAAAVLPGLAVLRALGIASRDGGVGIGLAAGLGLALHPLVFLWAQVLGVALGPWTWGTLIVASGVVAFAPARRVAKGMGGPARAWVRGTRPSGDAEDAAVGEPVAPSSGGVEGVVEARSAVSRRTASAVLALLVAMSLVARWWAAHGLSVPMWGDSVHHAMIVRLFAAHGGLVRDWLPEVSLATFTYHFGLHAGVTGLVWLTGLAPHRALIVAGQTLMVLQVLTAYALGAGLTGRRWAGVGAAMAAAGLSPMPGYYVNWGRYTQLAGQTILPAAALLTIWTAGGMGGGSMGAHGPRIGCRSGLRLGAAAALAVAGLALTHYLVTATFALLALAWWIVAALATIRGGMRGAALATARGEVRGAAIATVRRRVRGAAIATVRGRVRCAAMMLARLVGVAAAAVAVAGPWLPVMAGGVLFQTAVAVTTEAVPAAVYGAMSVDALREALPHILAEHARLRIGWPLLGAAGVAAAWALARRERLAATGLAWTALLSAAAFPWSIGLPFGAVLKDFTVAIGLYLPLGLIVGGALGDAVDAASARWRRGPLIAAALVVAVVAVAAWHGRAAPVAENRLVTAADEAAMAWVRANTPPDARFLVSGFLAFDDTVAAGDDAGWWLPQLAERATTLPPITYGLERPVEDGYRESVNAVYAALENGPDDPVLLRLLAARGVTHAFVGATGHALDGDALAASAHWRQVYGDVAGSPRVFERRGDDG